MIRILFFGVLKERLGVDEERLDWSGGTTDELLTLLRARGDIWRDALAPQNIFRLVVDQQMIRGSAQIRDGAEVGILPPVTGG